MKKGYTSHRNLETEIKIDLGEIGEVIKALPEDSADPSQDGSGQASDPRGHSILDII